MAIFYLNIFFKCNLFLLCKAEFSATLLQSLVSHDPSEIVLEKILLLIFKTVVLLHIFVKTMIDFFFQDFFDVKKAALI